MASIGKHAKKKYAPPLHPSSLRNAVDLSGAQQSQVKQIGPKADKKIPKRFTPIGDAIAGWMDPYEDKTKGGLYVNEETLMDYQTPIFNVVAIGPDVKQIKEGDRCLISPSTPGSKIIIPNGDDKEAILLVRETHVLAVCDPSDPLLQPKPLKSELITE